MLQLPFKISFLLNASLFGFLLLPGVRSNPALMVSFVGIAVVCLIWNLVLLRSVVGRKRILSLNYLAKGNHWIQLIVQAIIVIYICLHWSRFVEQLPLILAQIILAYIIEILMQFSIKDKVVLGFGPFPIVISINLFIWFKDEYFYLQFIMVALGILFKYILTWERWGRKRHVFNPSSISLFFFSLFLILTNSTVELTHAIDVSTKIYPDSAYLLLFLTGLIVQYFFSVTLMTLFGVGVLVFLGMLAYQITGVYWFVDSNIPPAVFLGLHLLITDPKTAPKSTLGRCIFGLIYGTSIFVLYLILDNFGAPTLYDKILFIPFMNLMAPWVDQISESISRRFENVFSGSVFRQIISHNLFHMALWLVFFGALLHLGYFTPKHPGRNFAFWDKACAEGNKKSCSTLIKLLWKECEADNPTACNRLGVKVEENPPYIRDFKLDISEFYFNKACQKGDTVACLNFLNNYLFKKEIPSLRTSVLPALKMVTENCRRGNANSCFVGGHAFYMGIGVESSKPKAAFLFSAGCDLGQTKACGRLGHMYLTGDGVDGNFEKAAASFAKACGLDDAASCRFLGLMYSNGDAGEKSPEKARRYMDKSCSLGVQEACDWVRKNN